MSGLRDRNACDMRVGEETMPCYCLPNVEICLFSLYLDVSLDTDTAVLASNTVQPAAFTVMVINIANN